MASDNELDRNRGQEKCRHVRDAVAAVFLRVRTEIHREGEQNDRKIAGSGAKCVKPWLSQYIKNL